LKAAAPVAGFPAAGLGAFPALGAFPPAAALGAVPAAGFFAPLWWWCLPVAAVVPAAVAAEVVVSAAATDVVSAAADPPATARFTQLPKPPFVLKAATHFPAEQSVPEGKVATMLSLPTLVGFGLPFVVMFRAANVPVGPVVDKPAVTWRPPSVPALKSVTTKLTVPSAATVAVPATVLAQDVVLPLVTSLRWRVAATAGEPETIPWAETFKTSVEARAAAANNLEDHMVMLDDKRVGEGVRPAGRK